MKIVHRYVAITDSGIRNEFDNKQNANQFVIDSGGGKVEHYEWHGEWKYKDGEYFNTHNFTAELKQGTGK